VGEVLSKNSSEEEKNNKLPNYEFSFQPLVIEREKEPISSYLLHRIKKDEDYTEPLFYVAGQEGQRCLGCLPVLDSNNSMQGERSQQYVSENDKRRQIEKAKTPRIKEKLLAKWGIKDHKEIMRDVHYTQQLLRNGLKQLESVRSVEVFTERVKELARGAMKPPEAAVIPTAAEKKKITFAERKKKSEDIAKRQEAKAVKVNIKKALYKREAIDKAIQAKREGRLERLSEAVPDMAMVQESFDSSQEQAKVPVGFVTNLAMDIVEPAKKKAQGKKSILELKAELREQLARKKQMHQRQEEGEEGEDEVRGLKMEEVLRRARGEKISNDKTVARDLAKARHREKNRGVKLAEALQRQDEHRHRHAMKRSQNIRNKRVEVQAKRITKLKKQGRVLPGY